MDGIAEQSAEPQAAGLSWNWPVRWSSAVRLAAARGHHPDVLLDDPDFVAHRILDRLAAQAYEVYRGEPGASEAFVGAISELVWAAPWLLDPPSEATGPPRYAVRRDRAREESSGSLRPEIGEGLVDDSGVSTLLAVASRLTGRDGATAIIELAATAKAAERWLPSLSRLGDGPYRADLLLLGGMSATSQQSAANLDSDATRSSGRPTPQADSLLIGHTAVWKWLNVMARENGISDHRCAKLLFELTTNAEATQPMPNGPVVWTTGIARVEVSDPCGASPVLTIHGRGFGNTASPKIGVVAPFWDVVANSAVYLPARVLNWSDTRVVVQLSSANVGGTAAFTNLEFLAAYDNWNRQQSRIIAGTMTRSGCPGYDGPNRPLLWPPFSESPPPTPAATFQTGVPRIVAEITRDPSGLAAERWDFQSAHFKAGQVFWVGWRAVNATSVVLRPSGVPAAQTLADSGHPASGVIGGARGQVRLVAPGVPAILELTIEASNAHCAARTPLRVVVTGAALGPPTITVLQSLPGGDIDVLLDHATELLDPNPFGGLSIPLVADKRTVVRINWWPAVPQVPSGVQLEAIARLEVHSHGTSSGGTLRPGASTAEEPPVGSITLFSGPPFSSLGEYEQWVNNGNDPATFNVVIPPQWCSGDTLLTATITAFSPARVWTLSAAKWVKFHRRHRARIRYRRHSVPNRPAPTTDQAVAAIRVAASLLPIPDPEIVVLNNDPVAQNGRLIEDMFAERGGVPSAEWRNEIWLVVGPIGVGGVALPQYPWIAATDATAATTAHEIGHLFGQPHLALCGAAQNPESPASFPQQGNVVVIGWDVWNNGSVRNAIDIMTYCSNRWTSPERWRRIFLRNRP